MAVAFSPDGKLDQVVTGSIDATANVWDSVTGDILQKLPHRSWVNAVAFGRDGMLATGSSDNIVRLWTFKAGQWTQAASFEFPEGEVRSLAVAPDGKTLAAGVRYGVLKTIDIASKKVTTHKAHAADVWSVAFSPDGKTLATGNGDWDRPGEVKLWDTASWKERSTLKTNGEVLGLAFAPNGRRLAAACWDGAVHVWPLERDEK